jgi:hypothetical protein
MGGAGPLRDASGPGAYPPEVAAMTLTPGLRILGLVLVLMAIPLAFSLGPLIVGVIVLAFGVRRAHEGLAPTI